MLTLLKIMNHLFHMQMYFALICAAILKHRCKSFHPQKKTKKNTNHLVSTETEQNVRERRHSLCLHPCFPSLPLFIVSFSDITSASVLFLFFLIHDSSVSRILSSVLPQQSAFRFWFYWCEINTRFDAFSFVYISS